MSPSRTSGSEGSKTKAWPRIIETGVIFIWLFGVSVFATRSEIDVRDLAALAVLYGLLSWFLGLVSETLSEAGWPLRAAGSLAMAAVLVWHGHEELLVPAGKAALLTTTVLVGIVHWLLAARCGRGAAANRLLRLSAAAAAFAVLLAVGYHGSPTLRWHLLRHNKLVGTPAYYLLDEPVAARERALRAQYRPFRLEAEDASFGHEQVSSRERPNIVFVVVDTLRADALGDVDAPRGLMPMTERLVANSRFFVDLQANSSWTKPSVASFFTGLLPEEHGALDIGDLLADAHVTLAERLTAMGYRCAAFVTNEHLGKETNFDQGFEHFEMLRDDEQPYVRAASVNRIVRRSLDDLTIDTPLFLYVHYFDPHMPYLSGGRNSVFPATARAAYEKELEYLDSELADMVGFLKQRLGRQTVFLITSDHGEEFGEHDGNYLRHGHSLYREVLQIPAVLHLPDGRHSRIDARLEGRDLFDLIIALASGSPLDVEQWAGDRDRETRYALAYLSMNLPPDRPYLNFIVGRAVDHDKRVLIWSAYGNTLELYDLEGDPGQTRNLLRHRPRLADDLRVRMNAAAPYWYGRQQAEVSRETARRLRALGYLD